MNNAAPAVCPRCGRSNIEGGQFCIGCAEPFVPPNQMTEAQQSQYLLALRNWYLLYLDPGGPPSLAETCTLCKEKREPDALFCGNCGTVFSSLFNQEPSPILYQMMLTARLARFQYWDREGKTPIDYGVKDFTSRDDVRNGLRKKMEMIKEVFDQLESVIRADFQQQEEEARVRAEATRQNIMEWVDHEVLPVMVKVDIAAREVAKRIARKATEPCQECGSQFDPNDTLSQIRGTCQPCWERMPWQVRAMRAGPAYDWLIADNRELASIVRVPIWHREALQRHPLLREAIGTFPAGREHDVMRVIRSATEPLQERAGYQWYFSELEFCALYPETWRTKPFEGRYERSVNFASPGGDDITVRVYVREWAPIAPRDVDSWAEAGISIIRRRGHQVTNGPTICEVDSYKAAQVHYVAKAGLFGRTKLSGFATLVSTEDRRFFIEGETFARNIAEFEAIYRLFIDSFRISPLPDREYLEWLETREGK